MVVVSQNLPKKQLWRLVKIKERYYIATMKVYDDEGLKKVERRRNMRDNKGFKTIECPDNIGEIIDQYNFFSSTVLFECMSNYLANKMFGEDNIISNNILSEIISDISNLSKNMQQFNHCYKMKFFLMGYYMIL